MQLDVSRIEKAEGAQKSFDMTEHPEPIQFAGAEYAYEQPVHLTGKVMNQFGILKLDARMTATMTLHCARCLAPFPMPLDVQIEEEFAKEADPEHPDRRIYEGDTLSLLPVVEEQVLVEMPIEQLCRRDCKGLCPICGADLNEGPCSCRVRTEAADHPFSALQTLLNEDEEV